jgi:hypothetical protein
MTPILVRPSPPVKLTRPVNQSWALSLNAVIYTPSRIPKMETSNGGRLH